MTTNVLSRRRPARAEEPEWVVWALVILMLAVGLIVRTVLLSRSESFSQGGVTLRYPAGWVSQPEEGPYDMLHVGEPFETALFPAGTRIQQMPVTEVSTMAQSLGDLAMQWTNRQSQELLGFRVLAMEPTTVQEQPAVRIDYAYVADPAMGGPNSMPVVARATDLLVRAGEQLTIVTLASEETAYDGLAGTWNRILGSLELR